jgi:hypothetical protein
MALVNPNQPIHPDFHERISIKLENQLPAFVKEDHASFVLFMEAYYEYMEQQGKPYEIIGNLDHYANVDKTTDEFLKYFKKQFGEDIPEAVFANANKPFVLKHLRDFYRTKGSEKSFQFLFRLLYKEEIDFYYPGKDMLRVSDGKYNTSKIIRTIDTSGDDSIFKLTSKKITGLSSGATAVVETIINQNMNEYVVSTIFLSGVIGTFVMDETITDGTYSFRAGGMIVDYTITNPGNNYVLGGRIPVTGGGAISDTSYLTIKELTSGSITSAVPISGGTGYVVGDKLTIDNWNNLDINGRTASIVVKDVDGSGAITELEIENSGRGYTSVPTITGGGSGNGANITLGGFGIGGIKTLDIISGGFGYSSNAVLNFSGSGDGTATGITINGAYEDSFQKGYTTNDGFLSSPKYIQDSHYYQLFSYVIKSGQTIDKWRDTVKRVTHPAGLALFGNFQIVTVVATKLKITGIPQRRDYKIIFHSGTVPPVIADISVDTCMIDYGLNPVVRDGVTINWKVAGIEKEYYPVTENDQHESEDLNNLNAISSTEDDEGITGSITGYQDDGSIVPTWFYKPTKCQIYEKDLAIQYLDMFTSQDYRYALEPVTEDPNPNLDDGLITEPTNLATVEDWGDLFTKSQMRLGPLRRTIESQKFNKFGGFSQTIGEGTESGSILEHFQTHTTDDYYMSGNLKTKIGMNSTVTQYPLNIEVHSSDPVADTNPASGVGTYWYNTVSGQKFICTDATTDANVWTIQSNVYQTVDNTARLTGYTGQDITTDDPAPAARVLPPSA